MGKPRILVVDDDEFIRGLMSISLTSEGYEVFLASDGQEGFNKAVTENYDLILTDIKMPNWNGAESIYGLDLVNNKTKILVVSGFIEDDLRIELKEHKNVIGIFSKPFDTLELLEFIKKALNNNK